MRGPSLYGGVRGKIKRKFRMQFFNRKRARAIARNRRRRYRRLKRRKRTHVKTIKNRKEWVGFPATLDIVKSPKTAENLYLKLRETVIAKRSAIIFIDHSKLRRVTPESVLWLIATMDLFSAASPEAKFLADPASVHHSVREVLGQVGYLEHFAMTWQPQLLPGRDVLRYASATYTDASKASRVIEAFKSDPLFPGEIDKALGAAIIECMDNTSDHAFSKPLSRLALHRKWWLLGMRDTSHHEFCFVFYDQGLGLTNTLRFKKRDKILAAMGLRSDAQLLRAALEGRFSRTRDENRGRGLPRLKNLIDKSDEGELQIMSSTLHLRLKKGDAEPQIQRLSVDFHGTLILWKIKAVAP